MSGKIIELYTDGSCHTQLKVGGWAAIIRMADKNIILEGTAKDTSHNSMELLAVVEGVAYIKNNSIEFDKISVYSDSQYVVNIAARREKLERTNYLTKKGDSIRNTKLVQQLVQYIETYRLEFIKVMAHQKQTEAINYNREADKLARKRVREEVKKMELAGNRKQ